MGLLRFVTSKALLYKDKVIKTNVDCEVRVTNNPGEYSYRIKRKSGSVYTGDCTKEWKIVYMMEKEADELLHEYAIPQPVYTTLLVEGNKDSLFSFGREKDGWWGKMIQTGSIFHANFLWNLLDDATKKIPVWETVEFATLRCASAPPKDNFYVITYETNNGTRPRQIMEVSQPSYLLEGNPQRQAKIDAMPIGVRNVKCRRLQGCD